MVKKSYEKMHLLSYNFFPLSILLHKRAVFFKKSEGWTLKIMIIIICNSTLFFMHLWWEIWSIWSFRSKCSKENLPSSTTSSSTVQGSRPIPSVEETSREVNVDDSCILIDSDDGFWNAVQLCFYIENLFDVNKFSKTIMFKIVQNFSMYLTVSATLMTK